MLFSFSPCLYSADATPSQTSVPCGTWVQYPTMGSWHQLACWRRVQTDVRFAVTAAVKRLAEQEGSARIVALIVPPCPATLHGRQEHAWNQKGPMEPLNSPPLLRRVANGYEACAPSCAASVLHGAIAADGSKRRLVRVDASSRRDKATITPPLKPAAANVCWSVPGSPVRITFGVQLTESFCPM